MWSVIYQLWKVLGVNAVVVASRAEKEIEIEREVIHVEEGGIYLCLPNGSVLVTLP